MREACKLGLYSGPLLNSLCKAFGKACAVGIHYTLGNNNDHASLAQFTQVCDLLDSCILIERNLGNGYRYRTACDCCVERDLSAVAAHNFNNVETCVRFAGILEVVNHTQGGVCRCVKTDGVVGCGNVVINGAGNADGGNAELGHIGCTAEGSVTANADECFNALSLAGLNGDHLYFSFFEFGQTAGIQACAANRHSAAHHLTCQGNDIPIDKACVAAHNANDLNAHFGCAVENRFYARVHAGSIAARGENANFLKCHKVSFLPAFREN